MSATLVDEVREDLRKALNEGPNKEYYIREAMGPLKNIERYIQSLEDSNAVMIEEIRRNRKK